MQFTPKSKKEIAEDGVLPAGVYGFEIIDAEDTTSKRGNDMIALNMKVYRADGGFKFQRDWLMADGFGIRKLQACAEVCGLMDAYEAGALDAEDFVGKTGFVKIGQKDDAQYGLQNNVSTYLTHDNTKPLDVKAVNIVAARVAAQAAGAAKQATPKDFDDEVPF